MPDGPATEQPPQGKADQRTVSRKQMLRDMASGAVGAVVGIGGYEALIDNDAPPKTQEAEAYLALLPPELSRSIRGFYRDLAQTVATQQTTVQNGKEITTATPDQVAFYSDHLNQVLQTGFLNPQGPEKKIT